MKYENIVNGNFISRPNRFVAEVMVNGKPEMVHVKNTGRCRELLTPGAKVCLEDFSGRMGTRKMRYSLIAVYKNELLINMDSNAPNKVCEEALRNGLLKLEGMEKLTAIKSEKTYGKSRFDFYLEDERGTHAWLEVKGVTLERAGDAIFPDAPTERGVKHIDHLIEATEEGYRGYILFVVQFKGGKSFAPNDETHKMFGDRLREAQKRGVRVMAYDCKVKEDSLELNNQIKVIL